jgi:hypothetical protein
MQSAPFSIPIDAGKILMFANKILNETSCGIVAGPGIVLHREESIIRVPSEFRETTQGIVQVKSSIFFDEVI